MTMKRIWLIIVLGLTVTLAAEQRYNFTYTFQGDAHGTILLVIPFRVYYESSASVDFVAVEAANGSLDFRFDGIADTGYMMRTSGFGGKVLAILTADYDYETSIPFGEEKLSQIEAKAPYYANYIKRKKNFQYKILSRDPGAIRFSRSADGIHSGLHLDFPVQFRYYPEVLNIDFFIYPIMMEILRGYDHGFVNACDLQRKKFSPGTCWQSPTLDYSEHMNRIAPLAARVMKRLKAFRQAEPFRLQYRVVAVDGGILEIDGFAAPRIPIWGSFLIKSFHRNIKTRLDTRRPVADILKIEIGDSKSNKLAITASLRAID